MITEISIMPVHIQLLYTMNNPFSQPKFIYKIYFSTDYKSIEKFEEFFPEEILGLSTYAIESEMIHAQADDLWSFEAYASDSVYLNTLKQDLVDYANEHDLLLNSDITIESVEDRDWVTEYQKQLKPIIVGRFFIASMLQKELCPDDKTPIYIEASRAFGTGDHATTSLCIEAMELIEQNNVLNIFDIGTGSGILAFAGEKIWPKADILACDIEEVSVEIAKENLSINNSNVQFYQNTEDDLMIPNKDSRKFDLIIGNILAQPLITMAHEIKYLSCNNTKVILSGFLDYQQNEVEKAYNDIGFSTEGVLHQDKWVALILSVKGS